MASDNTVTDGFDEIDELISSENSKPQESPIDFSKEDAPVSKKTVDDSGVDGTSRGVFRPLVIAMISLLLCQFLGFWLIFKFYVADKPEIDLSPMNQTFGEVVKLGPEIENIAYSVNESFEKLTTQVASKADLENLNSSVASLLKNQSQLISQNKQLVLLVENLKADVEGVASNSNKLSGVVRQIQSSANSSVQNGDLSPSSEPKKEEQSGYRYKFKHVEVQEK